MKFYRVPLYSVDYNITSYGKLNYIGDIIVKKKLFGISEVVTGYSYIDLFHKSNVNGGFLQQCYRKKKTDSEYHLITFYEEFNHENIVLESDINEYISSYDESNWKKIFDFINKESEKIKKNIKIK